MTAVLFILTLLLCLASGRYEIVDNEASRNIFHSDRQSAPVIGPHPHKISSGNQKVAFHECMFEVRPSDIVDIYRGVMFGKNHLHLCKTLSRSEISSYVQQGHSFINVDIRLTNELPLIPSGFDIKYEKYNLTVSTSGEVKLTADYYPGLVRGLDTLSQLIVRDEKYENIYEIEYLPITIEDEPAYPYRGVMVDTAREYFYPDTIKQILDGMMLGRMNIFHWHFSDDDSFPMYSESYPNLTDYTAFSPKEIYKPDVVKDIVNYAKMRAIKVVPEFEGPGHLHSLGFYPEFKDLIGCFRNYTVEKHANGGPPSAPIDPINNKTYEFLSNFMNDMAKNFDTDLWHLGGDEVGTECWKSLSAAREYLAKPGNSLANLQQYYIDKEREIVASIDNKSMAIYWYQQDHMNYHKEDILQFWGRSNTLNSELQSHPNNYFILSPNDQYYLDCGYTNQNGDHVWCGSMKSWTSLLDFNPNSYKKYSDKILGSEVCAWSEMNNMFDLPTKIFPKGGGMSFKHWNPEEPSSGGHKTEMMMRYQYRLKSYGVPVEKISMRYCEVHTHHCFGI